jgi:non-ribosomal peptide synthetase component F
LKLGDFSVLDELQDQDSFQDVVNRFNETATDYPSASTVNEIFQHRVDESPDAIAVKDPDRFYTYAELDRRSNKLSHYLLSRTIAPESFVAIMMDGSCDATVAI